MKSIRCAPVPARSPRGLQGLPVRARVRAPAGGHLPVWVACTGLHLSAGALLRAGPAPDCGDRPALSSLLGGNAGAAGPQPSPLSAERASAGILSMTCWPRGRGGLPIRNRSLPASTGESRNQNPTAESDWEPPRHPGPRLALPQPPRRRQCLPRPGRLAPLGGGRRGPAAGVPMPSSRLRPGRTCCRGQGDLGPAVPHVLTRGCVHRPRSRCFLSERGRKSYHFFIQSFFSDI